MVAVTKDFPRLTLEEYFVWEEQQNLRYEYIDGAVYAMTGGTVNHGRIAANFIAMLIPHLRGSSCCVQTSDVKIAIAESNDYVYPDISVSCDDRDCARGAAQSDRTAIKFISHPCLVVEILSPSTEADDRGDKFRLYRRSPSLQDYVLISASKIAIDIYSKNDSNRWEIVNYVAGDSIELASINLTFPIEEIFEGIVFE
jgi:Uma2 family endonuclease